MSGRVLLIVPLVWVSISSAVCQAACTITEGLPAMEPGVAVPASHSGCDRHGASDAPPGNRSPKGPHLDCCLAMGAPAVDRDRGVAVGTPVVAHIVAAGPHVEALQLRGLDHAPKPPGLNSPFARNNPHLLI